MKGYGIVSATSVVVGEYRQCTTFKDCGYVDYGIRGQEWGRTGRKVFDNRAACVAAVDAKLAKKRASLRKQLAELEALTGEAVVAAAEAKGAGNGEA